MSLDNELDAMTRSDNESPSIKSLQRKLDRVTEHAAKVEALLIDVAEKYMMQRDGKYEGEFSTRLNMLIGGIR